MATTKVESKRSVIDVGDITVTAGQTLKIETSPDGEDILEEICPEGQVWTVTMHIQISIVD